MGPWAVLLLAAAIAHTAQGTPTLAVTPLGAVLGEETVGSFRMFRGLRYAEPPRRFEAPEPKKPWTGVAAATHFGARCWGFPGGKVSEDCLFLNVWTPSPAPAKPVPVFLFIHGGGFIQGSGSDFPLQGDVLVQDKQRPIVYVSINYRMGILGFYSDREGGPANYGLQDQQQALRWVRQNIGAFGGDPSRVTIAGQSAGAMSVTCHLVAPGSRGLFHGAWVASAVGLNYRTRDANAAFVDSAAATLGCLDRKKQRQCLLSKPASILSETAIVADYLFHLESPCKGCDNWLPWMPVVDGAVLPRAPLDALRDGDHAGVPVVMSSLRNESCAFVPGVVQSLENLSPPLYDLILKAVFKESASAINSFYSSSPDFRGAHRAALFNIALTDGLFTCYARYVAGQLAKSSPAFLSFLLHAPSAHSDPFNRGVDHRCESGATCHAADLAYIFPRTPQERKQMGLWPTAAEEVLMAKYSSAVKAFVYGSFEGFLPYNSLDLSVGWVDSGRKAMQGYHSHSCNFLEASGIAEELWLGRAPQQADNSTSAILV